MDHLQKGVDLGDPCGSHHAKTGLASLYGLIQRLPRALQALWVGDLVAGDVQVLIPLVL